VSPLDSSHYIECIRKNRLNCNILNISFKQFLTILIQHLYMEVELKEAKEYIIYF